MPPFKKLWEIWLEYWQNRDTIVADSPKSFIYKLFIICY